MKLIPQGLMFMFICVCAAILPASHADAKRIALDTSSSPIVYDGADVLNGYEEVNIISALTGLAETDGYIYAVITTPDVNDYTIGNELEDIYNDHKSFFMNKGTVLFLINTDEENTFCELQGYGDAASFIPREICGYISGELSEYVSGGRYYDAVTALLDNLEKVRNGEITVETASGGESGILLNKLKERLPLILLALLASLAVSAFATILAAKTGIKKSAGAKPKKENPMPESEVKGRDMYVRSVINHYGRG